jgi:hypothetical protein
MTAHRRHRFLAKVSKKQELEMSDHGPHHPIAEAMRVAREEADIRDRINAPLSSGRPSHFGQGIGAASGWVVLFGMMGAILGGILGRGLTGAIVGAVVLGGGFGVVGFIGGMTSRIWDRGPVLVWVAVGGVAGYFFGAMITSDPINWAVAGMMLFGAYRFVTKNN